MALMYKQTNVFEEALERIRMLFDTHDDVIVSMSGGKDSTIVFRLALMVAREKNRLPLKVFWLDQEVEWQATVDYMRKIMYMPEVKPYWFQIPFDFTNSLSADKNFIRVWDEEKSDMWVHPKDPIAIKENPSKYTRFHDLVSYLPEYCTESDNCAVLVGMRMLESLGRKMAITEGKSYFRGETWCQKKRGIIQVFWPCYDFSIDDVWTAIAKNGWEYNKVYDLQYRWGVSKQAMRVSALIHETAWHSIEMLQEFEVQTYNRFVKRVPGVSTFNHGFDEGGIVPRKLPFAFKDWKEYRDYLLEHITKPEYKDLFRRRWKGQDSEQWYKVHVKEIILNDIDGTNNANNRKRLDKDKKIAQGFYNNKDLAQFENWRDSND